MSIDKIDNLLSENPRYRRLQKPLQAARICAVATAAIEPRARVVSYKLGVLTVAVESAPARYRLEQESQAIQLKINQKLGREEIKRIRIKIIPR